MHYKGQTDERANMLPEILRAPFYKGYSDRRHGFRSTPPDDPALKEAYFAGWNWAVEMSRADPEFS